MKKQNEIVKIFNLPFTSKNEAVKGVNISNIFKRHIHKVFIIGKVTEGTRIIKHSEGVSQISKGEIFIINPRQTHACCSSYDTKYHSYQILSVAADKMQSVSNEISEKKESKPFFSKVRYINKIASQKISKIFTLLEANQSQLEIETEIMSLLSEQIIRYSECPPKICSIGDQYISIKRVCDYIANNYSKTLSLDQLSKIACLSPFHFQRTFTKIMGISAHEYQIHYRISESKTMLLNSIELADIAIETGFTDQSHFSRMFKKIVGIPPGKYNKINNIG